MKKQKNTENTTITLFFSMYNKEKCQFQDVF